MPFVYLAFAAMVFGGLVYATAQPETFVAPQSIRLSMTWDDPGSQLFEAGQAYASATTGTRAASEAFASVPGSASSPTLVPIKINTIKVTNQQKPASAEPAHRDGKKKKATTSPPQKVMQAKEPKKKIQTVSYMRSGAYGRAGAYRPTPGIE
jgi:hypothetical protein